MFPYYFVTSKKDTGGGCWGGTKVRKTQTRISVFFLTTFFFFFFFFLFCQGVTQKGRQGGKPQSLFGLSDAGKYVS